MRIKLIRARDPHTLHYCFSIRHKVFADEMDADQYIERDRFDSFNLDCDHFLIAINNDPVGSIRVLKLDKRTIRLQRFCILKNYRRRGIGLKVLRMIERYYFEKGYEHIILDTLASTKDLFMRQGYSVIFSEFAKPSHSGIIMEKRIH